MQGLMMLSLPALFALAHSSGISMQSLLLAREHVQTVTDVGKAERVFDIEVDGQHEFFASGLLVHNCIDAVRYAIEPLIGSMDAMKRFKALSL